MNLSKVPSCIIPKPNILMREKCLTNRPVAWLAVTYKLQLINFITMKKVHVIYYDR